MKKKAAKKAQKSNDKMPMMPKEKMMMKQKQMKKNMGKQFFTASLSL